jgi:ubiquinone/menaquinone biosynthesis C-methylase UbiE
VAVSESSRIYQHPLAYLIGLEGVALLKAFAGRYDEAFTRDRLAEVRRLLDAADGFGSGAEVPAISVEDGYRRSAEGYDTAQNQLIDLEQPVVWSIIDALPVGTALDVACGTGRHTAHLAALGHEVIGVDASPEMLALARRKLPDVTFHRADLHRLPVADARVNILVCALALTHVPDLTPVLAEFTRVLKPGGHLVLSDSRGVLEGVGLPMPGQDADGRWGYMPVCQRRASDYLGAALPLGLLVRRCEEPRRPSPLIPGDPPPGAPPEVPRGGTGAGLNEPPSIWALHRYAPKAVNAAYDDLPAAIVWHFQKS